LSPYFRVKLGVAGVTDQLPRLKSRLASCEPKQSGKPKQIPVESGEVQLIAVKRREMELLAINLKACVT
jgi:hypothetical protein